MTYDEFLIEIRALSEKIAHKPDMIIGIVRGGIIPARHLSSLLKVKDMQCITVKKVGNQRTIMTEILEDVRGKRILIVEDMLESGKSLELAVRYFHEKEAIVETACLYTIPKSELKPTYSLQEISDIIPFPWE